MDATKTAGETTRASKAGPYIPAGITILHQAYLYARDVNRPDWDFAVEIRRLHAAGLDESDFRWLLCKGYIRKADEMTLAGEESRSFRKNRTLTFSRKSCFVLTDVGARFAKKFLNGASAKNGSRGNGQTGGNGQTNGNRQTNGNGQTGGEHQVVSASPVANGNGKAPRPSWDADRRELRLGDRVIKRFKWNAMNQETVLAVFDEEGWPARIDDPLPPQPDQDPKRRLHDTIKCLNRNQKNNLIQFRGDGTGEGVRWELVDKDAS